MKTTKNISVYKIVESKYVETDEKGFKKILDGANTFTTTTKRQAYEIVEVINKFDVDVTVVKQTLKIEL